MKPEKNLEFCNHNELFQYLVMVHGKVHQNYICLINLNVNFDILMELYSVLKLKDYKMRYKFSLLPRFNIAKMVVQ